MIDLPWDPELDSPATIAIIGAGPIGIEAAIYARFLGYFVSIFDTRRVAHRMLDWNDRPLAVPVSECTSPLGHAAIKSQNPEYLLPDPDQIWSGKQYAENYLLPLAKTDLLFDDIHFLSPVTNISRLRTHLGTNVDPQTRCEDEFRIVVEGRHRGTWISRSDIVLDCRAPHEELAGMGPGGGLAIGELQARPELFSYSPRHRKFEAKQLLGKETCVVGTSDRACQFVQEYLQWHQPNTSSRLTWITNDDELLTHPLLEALQRAISEDESSELHTYSTLGIDKISKLENGRWQLLLVLGSDSTVELECDVVASFPEPRPTLALGEVDSHSPAIADSPEWRMVTREPGYYRLNGGDLNWNDASHKWNAGSGLQRGFEQIKKIFTLIVERDSLDLYQVMADNLKEGRV